MCVITDRLGKGVICEPCVDITAERVAKLFIQYVYARHRLLQAIVSDRGTQFVGLLWTRVCKLLKITRQLSTAYYPETDGSTERTNQNVEVYLRTFVNLAQDN
jgi:transposase InsO family protein